MQDMGVEPYLVASSLLMVQAQRLVRRLCVHCRRARPATHDDWRLLEADPDIYAGVDELFEAVGCDSCMHTGYTGRVAIYEMILISDAMRNVIHDGRGLPAMRRLAKKEAMVSLRHDGARHVAAGTTAIDEVLRVSMEDTVAVEA